MSVDDKSDKDDYSELRKMVVFGWFMKGARAMHRRLVETFEKELLKGKDGPYNNAILKMIYDSKNTENFLLHNFDEIRFKNHVRDKKGRLISCEAYLARRKEIIEEVNDNEF